MRVRGSRGEHEGNERARSSGRTPASTSAGAHSRQMATVTVTDSREIATSSSERSSARVPQRPHSSRCRFFLASDQWQRKAKRVGEERAPRTRSNASVWNRFPLLAPRAEVPCSAIDPGGSVPATANRQRVPPMDPQVSAMRVPRFGPAIRRAGPGPTCGVRTFSWKSRVRALTCGCEVPNWDRARDRSIPTRLNAGSIPVQS